ncbi:DUF6525 family protein [Bradyrhizobium sp. B124]|uniref:DUF6525 family protein n=1 Tax=Bradyrhizobium sp. B124 TaxID=3140245 RepID=UPI003183D0C8
MSNTNAASRVAYEKRTMAYFDRLPRSVRHAVANARFDWTLNKLLRAYERGHASAPELVAAVERMDKEETAKTRFRAWGGEYPIFAGELTHIPLARKPKRKNRR